MSYRTSSEGGLIRGTSLGYGVAPKSRATRPRYDGSMELRFRRLDSRAMVPSQGYPGDAGFDLYCLEDHYSIQPGQVVDIPTGLAIQLPAGHWGRVVGRSSTIRKRGLLVIEGIIDNSYRGHLFFAVFNPGAKPVPIRAGERLAQLILMPLITPTWRQVDSLDETGRGESGFGSTGE